MIGGGGFVAKSCLIFVTPWNVTYQAPLSLEFPRQEYWRGLPFPSPGYLPNPEIKSESPVLQVDFFLPIDLPWVYFFLAFIAFKIWVNLLAHHCITVLEYSEFDCVLTFTKKGLPWWLSW